MAKWEYVQSVVKALDILKIVSESSAGIRLNEISEQMGQKNTTVHNLVRTLTAKGYLKKDNNNKYSLGNSVEDLYEQSTSNKLLASLTSSILELSETLPTCIITVATVMYSEITVKLRISPDRPGVIQRPQNQTFPVYTSVTGLLYMALASSEIESVLARYPFMEYGSHIWKTQSQLAACLSTIRKHGYSDTSLFPQNEVLKAAYPIYSKGNALSYVLGIHIKNALSQQERQKIIAQVTDFSKNISL